MLFGHFHSLAVPAPYIFGCVAMCHNVVRLVYGRITMPVVSVYLNNDVAVNQNVRVNPLLGSNLNLLAKLDSNSIKVLE